MKKLGRFASLCIGAFFLALTLSLSSHAQSASQEVQGVRVAVDTVWVLISGVLVFFMQTGFAMLEAGLIRRTGVVNCLLENFIDAALTAIAFWFTGFALAFGQSVGGIFGSTHFMLLDAIQWGNGAVEYAAGADGAEIGISRLSFFFFQFAFSATASTITTGAMAERTNFVGDLIYCFVLGAFSYPIVVHWVWNSEGWLQKIGYLDFAGSSVVHTFGGVTALIGAFLLGKRANRDWEQLPPGHNMALATLGTLILWFGWYGFNAGSTLGTGNDGLIGLVMVNTTLAAAAGALTSIIYVYSRIQKWHLFVSLNGTLAGLVGVTAGCAYIAPWAAIVIGAISGVLVIMSADYIESLRIDDPVGAFSVHGSCGIFGTVMVGLLAQPQLTPRGQGGVFFGNGTFWLIQVTGVLSITIFAAVSALILFGTLKYLNLLRVPPAADKYGIDVYEHGASAYPDTYSIDESLIKMLEEED
ncbi:MAG: ammonium transporter [Oscillatoriales cyanobacterium SM2_2_1]|nr:ammonium transporter [Oscillatoriales cyanobacterium SM2_2_1]